MARPRLIMGAVFCLGLSAGAIVLLYPPHRQGWPILSPGLVGLGFTLPPHYVVTREDRGDCDIYHLAHGDGLGEMTVYVGPHANRFAPATGCTSESGRLAGLGITWTCWTRQSASGRTWWRETHVVALGECELHATLWARDESTLRELQEIASALRILPQRQKTFPK